MGADCADARSVGAVDCAVAGGDVAAASGEAGAAGGGAGAFGTQLQHLLTDQECAAFLAAVPQAGRVLRPLFHMLGVSPVPEVVRKVRAPAVVVVPQGDLVGLAGVGVLGVGCQILGG